jgi:dUTP pyrophosphatase
MNIKIINTSPYPLPQYQTAGAAGMDLAANIEEAVTLAPLQRTLIPTGLYMEIPMGYEAQIRPRSGMAFKKGITVINAPGTIDSDYRGEVRIAVVNLSNETQIIEPGERVAQMVIAKHETITWEQVKSLEESNRGAGGFGHTGTK